jgi:hypothetical protein
VANLEEGSVNHEKFDEYTALIGNFVNGKIAAQEFEKRFLEEFKNETITFDPQTSGVLDWLFTAVDAFCPDPELCDEDDLNERQLRDKAAEALAELLET